MAQREDSVKKFSEAYGLRFAWSPTRPLVLPEVYVCVGVE